MKVDRCVCCGGVIPEGSQVCIYCLSGCYGCKWDDKDNCITCNGQKGDGKIEKHHDERNSKQNVHR